jgi:hypothetical protein
VNISEVPGLVAKMRDHRFNGYTDTGVAAEIEKFRGGDGIGSIGTAVEALKAVAGALAETDETLRRELGKLGVEWHSEAGGLASRVFTEQAGFSRDAKDKIDHSAEMIFAQGQAFSYTLYRLPDADTVRKGAGGFTLADTALSLIGFETDHVRDVVAANNARAQAVEALNGYAAQSAEILSSIETIAQPQGLRLDSSAGGPLRPIRRRRWTSAPARAPVTARRPRTRPPARRSPRRATPRPRRWAFMRHNRLAGRSR